MRIGMLARSLGVFRGGVDVYVRELAKALIASAPARGHVVHVYADDRAVADEFARAGGVATHVPMGPLGRLWWDHATTPIRCARDGIDVVVCPRSFRPLFVARRSVPIVYDMMYHDIREQSAWWDHTYFRTLHRLSLARSDAIAVFSRFTGERIAALFPRIPAGRVRLITPGPPELDFLDAPPPGAVGAALRRLGVDAPYVLAVGAHPRKNVDVVLRAVAALDDSTRLVVASAWRDEAHLASLARLADELGVRDRFRVLPGCPRADLVALYRGAAAFVYASSYEGIGIPPLEAMASGCPVVATRAASIPEVVDDAALLVPPRDVAALRDALRRVVGDPAESARLREAGARLVGRLDWRRSAEELLDVVEDVARR